MGASVKRGPANRDEWDEFSSPQARSVDGTHKKGNYLARNNPLFEK